MNDVLYRKLVTSRQHVPCGENGEYIYVTQENNGYGIWFVDWQGKKKLLFWDTLSDSAIERGVELGHQLSTDKDRINRLKNMYEVD